VVDGVGVHALHQRNVVDDLRSVGEQVGVDPPAGLALLLELVFGGRDGEARLPAGHRAEALPALHGGGEVLVEELAQAGLVVPQVDLRGPAVHVQVDDALRARPEVGEPGERGVDHSRSGAGAGCRRDTRTGAEGLAAFSQEHRQRRAPEAEAGVAEELAAGGQKLLL
jgi:hypothetical protein